MTDRTTAVTASPFAIVVPMKDAMRYLPVCLPALREAARRGGAELVLVDNGSGDGSRQWAADALGTAGRVLDAPGLSISAARNRGAAATAAATLVFVDADCEVPADHLAHVGAALDASGADAVGAPYALPASPHWVEAVWQQLHAVPGDGPAHHLPAGNLAVRRQAFDGVRGFDERLTTGEDAELCQRLRQTGARIERHSRIRVVHHGNPKSLRGFFAKQAWHAHGQFSTTGRGELDKPVIMMLVHAALILATVAAPLLVPRLRTATWLVAAVAAVNAVPVAAVWYRRRRLREPRPSWLRSVLLYHTYFAARLSTAARVLAGRGVRRG